MMPVSTNILSKIPNVALLVLGLVGACSGGTNFSSAPGGANSKLAKGEPTATNTATNTAKATHTAKTTATAVATSSAISTATLTATSTESTMTTSSTATETTTATNTASATNTSVDNGSAPAPLVDVLGSVPLTTSQTQNSVWVVTSDGNGAKIVLDAANKYPMTAFTGAGGGSGHRTFVSSHGLFIGTTQGGATGGKVYFMPNFFTAGAAAAVAADLNTQGIGGGSRVCVTVFTVSSTEYLGAGYTGADGHRKFYQAPIDASKAGYVDTSKGVVTDAGAGQWGYSCYTDPTRNYFWSKANSINGSISGINMATGASLTVASAPNGAFTMSGPGSVAFDATATTQSYAMAGGVDGSLLSSSRATIYNMAHEPVSGNVLVTTYAANPIYLLSAKCFTSIADCSGAGQSNTTLAAAYDASAAGFMGPMSSLNDGRVLGLERNATASNVFLMTLVDPKDISKGLTITKIQTVSGDSYMYSDFTGSMTVAAGSVKTIDVTKATGYNAGKPLKTVAMRWDAVTGTPPQWNGLTLSVGCYKSGDTPPTPGLIANVPAAGTDFGIGAAPGCDRAFDQIIVSVQPAAANTLVFSKTASFTFHGQQ